MEKLLLGINFVLLLLIIKNQKTMSEKLNELKQAVTDLQTSVDTKQAAIAEAIAALQAQIGNPGTTDEDLQGVINTLKTAQADIESTPTA